MVLRNFHERIFQTVAYELGGVLLVTPIYVFVFGTSGGQSFVVMASLSVATLIWFPLHNTAFDWCDLRLTGRLASDRPKNLRLLHALSHEITVCLITTPLLIWLGGHSFRAAIAIDLALSFAYAGYAYVFHLVYDHFRPVIHRQSPDLALGEAYQFT
jgi:uncharacterized membrane protein